MRTAREWMRPASLTLQCFAVYKVVRWLKIRSLISSGSLAITSVKSAMILLSVESMGGSVAEKGVLRLRGHHVAAARCFEEVSGSQSYDSSNCWTVERHAHSVLKRKSIVVACAEKSCVTDSVSLLLHIHPTRHLR